MMSVYSHSSSTCLLIIKTEIGISPGSKQARYVRILPVDLTIIVLVNAELTYRQTMSFPYFSKQSSEDNEMPHQT